MSHVLCAFAPDRKEAVYPNEPTMGKLLPDLRESRWPMSEMKNDTSGAFERFLRDPHGLAAAQKMPRAEHMLVTNAVANSSSTDPFASALRDEKHARLTVAFTRSSNRICNFCWSKDDTDALQCCAACELTFYCARECQAADWPSHRRWCCEADAKADEGPLRVAFARARAGV